MLWCESQHAAFSRSVCALATPAAYTEAGEHPVAGHSIQPPLFCFSPVSSSMLKFHPGPPISLYMPRKAAKVAALQVLLQTFTPTAGGGGPSSASLMKHEAASSCAAAGLSAADTATSMTSKAQQRVLGHDRLASAPLLSPAVLLVFCMLPLSAHHPSSHPYKDATCHDSSI